MRADPRRLDARRDRGARPPGSPRRLANADRALKGDITLTSTPTSTSTGASGGTFTGPQIKALGRDLAERIILERVVDGIVQLAA